MGWIERVRADVAGPDAVPGRGGERAPVATRALHVFERDRRQHAPIPQDGRRHVAAGEARDALAGKAGLLGGAAAPGSPHVAHAPAAGRRPPRRGFLASVRTAVNSIRHDVVMARWARAIENAPGRPLRATPWIARLQEVR